MLTYFYQYDGKTNFTTYIDSLNLQSTDRLLLQIFTTSLTVEDLYEVHDKVTALLPNIEIVAVHTNHFIFDGTLVVDSTIFAFTLLGTNNCKVFYKSHNEHNIYSISEHYYQNRFYPSFIQLLSTTEKEETQDFIEQLSEIMPTASILGGILAWEDENFLLYNKKRIYSGYLGIILSGEHLTISAHHTSGVTPIGKEHTVTSADNHMIYSVDNIPAKEFYTNYLSASVEENSSFYGHRFPLVFHKNNGKISSSVILQPFEEGIKSGIKAQTGDIISLGYRNFNSVAKSIKTVRTHLSNISCDYLFTYSSKDRIIELLKSAMDVHVNMPMFGLLTDYEFSTTTENKEIISDSFAICGLGSNHTSIVTDSNIDIFDFQTTEDVEKSILLKLVENTSQELDTLNKALEDAVIQKNNELLDQYYLDQLTRLPNLNRLSEDLYNKKPKGLALIDISAFVDINNFYGAQIGNRVLEEFAELVEDSFATSSYSTYRIYSDIFAIVTNEENFHRFANQMHILQSRIDKHCFINEKEQIYLNTTIALSNSPTNIYENASMTLQHAKSEKITYLVYNESLGIEESIHSNLMWSANIRQAIDNDRIVPFFQPMYNNDTKIIDRFEVLMRLVDDKGAIISPYLFLPIAKKAGLYPKLTKIIIKKAFAYFYDKNYKFSINLSSEDILNNATRSFIYNQLAKFPQPQNVVFEIVESESIENYDTVISFIREVKQYGAQIAIDDFGTGFSNFHYLFKLNVDCIKIDGTIIKQMNTDRSAFLVAESIVEFANKLGISTVAEYVADENTFNTTNSMGINYSQGYYVAKPLDSIEDLGDYEENFRDSIL